jgi:hypothetical protein
VVFIDDILIYS